MTPLKFFAIGAALLALAGCQAAGTSTSTYGGSLNSGQSNASKTVLKKAGKTRRVSKTGDVYYVNKYIRVPRNGAAKSTAAYAAKPRRSKSVKSFSKVLKKPAAVRKSKVAKRGKANKRVKNLDKLIAKHAKANGVPVKLARAVVKIESGGRVNARGAAGEVGLMQLMPRTARGMGYKGKMKRLYNPDTNLAYGMKYLGEAYRRGGKTTCGAILKYNAGHYAKRWNPTSRKYCKRVKANPEEGLTEGADRSRRESAADPRICIDIPFILAAANVPNPRFGAFSFGEPAREAATSHSVPVGRAAAGLFPPGISLEESPGSKETRCRITSGGLIPFGSPQGMPIKGQCHREQTACRQVRRVGQVRVKGWGKGPPRSRQRRTARQTPPGARPNRDDALSDHLRVVGR